MGDTAVNGREAPRKPPPSASGLKVLLVDPSQKGALPLYTGMIAQALAAVGVKPTVLGNADMVDPELDGSWQVMRRLRAGAWPPRPGTPSPRAVAQAVQWTGLALTLLATAREIRPDIIHVQHPFHPRLDHWLLSPLRGIAPVVWTAHDVLPHDGGANERARARSLYRGCDLVIVHNSPARDQVRRLAGVDAHVVHHPVRPLVERPSRNDARKRLGLGADTRVLSAVGFIRKYKGYGLLEAALRRCQRLDLKLVVLGELVDASEQEVLDALVNDRRADLRLGYASDRELIDLIAASDAVLLPHAAGSDSGSLHMARALGVPVLASNAPQISAVVFETQAGVVLERDPQVWAAAMDGVLPPSPPTPPTPMHVGLEHLRLYQTVLRGGKLSHR